MRKGDALDPRGLILESYRIEGITEGECRSIFLDWALSFEGEMRSGIVAMLERYGGTHPDHPMTKVLQEGLAKAEAPRRRGGWRSRDR
ncbi:hypothetical protein PGB28_11345 [Primorskyibacter aestuariivivens]|uniref:hypothetical protein n=1 Tax=Primorskyibacter aestuariivivens TaxID=1888912 RepID=UPI0022FFCB5A|nr:hypothetical protein [Primorskyibacter aestuariivivens]MDA7429053.1 hypothetical protein [Primorskyibacter aestuariivivens]